MPPKAREFGPSFNGGGITVQDLLDQIDRRCANTAHPHEECIDAYEEISEYCRDAAFAIRESYYGAVPEGKSIRDMERDDRDDSER